MDLDAGTAVLGAVLIAAAGLFIGAVLIVAADILAAGRRHRRHEKNLKRISEMDLTRPTRD